MTKLPLNFFRESSSDSILESFVESDGKNYYIEGVFAQAEKLNRNERIYPLDLLGPEIERYSSDLVQKGLAWGELDHPDIAHSVQMQQVSHRITEIRMSGNDAVGKAIITDSPNGKIVKACIDCGGQISVSTRGLGKSRTNADDAEVMEVYYLTAIDIVSFPSGIDCFVRGVKENFEIMVESDLVSKTKAFEVQKAVLEKAPEDLRVSMSDFALAMREILRGR